MTGQELKLIEEILTGIDKTETESPSGWWETSSGAEFGANRLEQIRKLTDEQGAQETKS